jgi:hypothetical protein
MDEELAAMQREGADTHGLKKKAGKINLEDDSLINELNFCFADPQTSSLSQHIDQFKDSTVLIRGANHNTVNKILSKIHFDYEPKTW